MRRSKKNENSIKDLVRKLGFGRDNSDGMISYFSYGADCGNQPVDRRNFQELKDKFERLINYLGLEYTTTPATEGYVKKRPLKVTKGDWRETFKDISKKKK